MVGRYELRTVPMAAGSGSRERQGLESESWYGDQQNEKC